MQFSFTQFNSLFMPLFYEPVLSMVGCSRFLLSFLLLNILTGDCADLDNKTFQDVQSNEGLNIFQIAKKIGYIIERHHVITEDGYTIELHRIPYGINSTDLSNRPPILIAHGTGGTSVEFLVMGKKSIASRLVEAGYDIWIGNSRGTRWSLKHKSLNHRSKQFWMFSWHEIGVYDYTAEIYYVSNVTGHDKIFFLGHSQGATAFLAMASDRPEINKKIRLALLLGPTAYTKHNVSPVLKAAADIVEFFEAVTDYLHLYEIPHGPILTQFFQMLCRSPFKFICSTYIHTTVGYDISQMDMRILPVLITNLPGGFSMRQLVHYGQIIRNGRFEHYDYGPEENLKWYGSTKPPIYNITKITAPVGLICGNTDIFVDPHDIHDLCNDLPNCVFNHLINGSEHFNHFAYLIGTDADRLLNDKLIEMYSKF